MARAKKEKVVAKKENEIKVVGIDIANSTLKVWTDDTHARYRNTIKEIDDSGLVYSFKTDFHMYVYEDEVYEVGDLSAMGSGSRGKARYTSKSFKIEAMIGLASVLKPGVDYKLKVVTGTPSFFFKDKNVINSIKKALIGSHLVKSVFDDKIDEIKFEIVDVVVVPQPLGTLYNYIFDEKTLKLNEKLVEQRALVIDIGWGTTDIAMLESGRVRSTFGFDLGSSDYISAIQEEVNNEIPQANIMTLNPHQVDVMLLEGNVVETPFGKFDLSKFTQENKEKLAERIYTEVMGIGLEFSRFYKIILTGGGSLLLEKELKQKFDDSRVVIAENAIEANVKGFFLLGTY